MRIVEFRIFVPIGYDKAPIASRYCVFKRSQEKEKNGKLFEVIESKPIEKDGVKGFYSKRLIHIKTRIPQFIKWVVPDKYDEVYEENTNLYPYVKGQFNVPGMGEDMTLITESQHFEVKEGFQIPENPINFNEEELAQREVIYLDIIDSPPPSNKSFDIDGFEFKEAGVTLPTPTRKYDENKPPAWIKSYKGPLTLFVKAVRFNFRWKGIQKLVESHVIEHGFHNTFVDSHRYMVRLYPEWYNKTLEEVIKEHEEFDKAVEANSNK